MEFLDIFYLKKDVRSVPSMESWSFWASNYATGMMSFTAEEDYGVRLVGFDAINLTGN